MGLHDKTTELARDFKRQADRLDRAFIETSDKRALQGGAICDAAQILRGFSNDLSRIARTLDEEGLSHD